MNAEWIAGNIAAHWIQAAALGTSALVTIQLLFLREPRARLAALHLTLVAIVLLPAVQPWTPDEPVPIATPVASAIDPTAIASEAATSIAPSGPSSVDPAFAAVMVVAAGVAIRLMWLFYSVVRLARFSRRASKASTPEVAGPLEAELAVSARYIQQADSRGPWTFGLFRPTIALPAGFDALQPAFQRSVICHELVHVKRRDMAVAFFEELAVTALWFHPWLWLVRARIRVAREQIVDSRVVAMLGNPDEYVRCLVDLSGHDLAPHFSQAGAGMLRPHELRARVDAIFREAHMSRVRFATAALAFVAVVIASGLAVSAAMPMRSAPIVLESSESLESHESRESARQSRGVASQVRLNPATSGPVNLQFKGARLRDVLAFIGHATSIVFTGYEESFDQGRSITIDGTIDAAHPTESVLDRLLPPNGLTYTVAGPRTVVIARSPLAELRQVQAKLEAGRRQINTVYPEYPPDALERGIRGTVVVDVTVNAAGDVTTAAVASGPQELRASALKAALQLKYTKGSSTTPMKVAFHYALTGTSWGVSIGGTLTNGGTRYLLGGPGTPETAVTNDARNPDETGAYRIGGALQPPKKLKDVPPTYPQAAQDARVQGVVIMEARIDEQGLVSDVRTLRSIPLLDQAAIDAVRQWQYTPTLLNGVAVPVRMTVTVSFTLRDPASGTFIHLQLLGPDGREFMNGEVPDNARVWIDVPDIAKFHLTASRRQDSEDVKVSFSDEALSHLGDVVLAANGPVLQSPTNPAFGIQLLGVRSRINIR